MTDNNTPIEDLLRELTPQVLGTVVRRFRDFAGAEDAVQEASLAAALQWPHNGLPDNPRAWLTQVAFRWMTDHIRSESARRRRESQVADEAAAAAPVAETEPQEDDARRTSGKPGTTRGIGHPPLHQSSKW